MKRRGFTLIELMVVVAIIAIIMTIGIPFIRMAIDNGRGMTKALKDIQEACSHARAIAILQQTTCSLRIRPGDGTFEVSGAGGGGATSGDSGKGFSSKLPDGIRIEGLGVNGEDWTEDPEASVRFFANGTCDAMSVVLLSDENETRNIWLEVVTGLPEVETDPKQFRHR